MIYFPISQVTASEIAGFACYQRMFHGGLAEWDALPPREKDQFIPLNQDTWGNPLAHISRALGWGPGPGPGLAPGPGPGPGAILGPGARGPGPVPGAGARGQRSTPGDRRCGHTGSVSRRSPDAAGGMRAVPRALFLLSASYDSFDFPSEPPPGPIGFAFLGSDRVGAGRTGRLPRKKCKLFVGGAMCTSPPNQPHGPLGLHFSGRSDRPETFYIVHLC